MIKILEKIQLSPQIKRMTFSAPVVAKKCLPGQFIILRADEKGERIPLTIADYDREKGTVTVIFQEIGLSTMKLGAMEAGQSIAGLAGPLGVASHLDGLKKVCVIGGGLGCAIAYPQAKYLHEHGAEVDLIAGFRSKDIIFFEKEMASACTRLFIRTDDGSNGNKGFVTDELKALIEAGNKYDAVIAIGPVIMMKFVSLVTKPYGIKTIVSLNPIMVDGTGMCGGCRVTVGGQVKFACVDGPDFDGHEVDFDELMRRNAFYKDEEKHSVLDYECRLNGGSGR